MNITLPNFNTIIEKIISIQSTFDGDTKSIKQWVDEHRTFIQQNNELLEVQSESNIIMILKIILNNLLMRSMRGERGSLIRQSLDTYISSINDLNQKNYDLVLSSSKYRWQEAGKQVIINTIDYFKNELNWNWKLYFSDAELNYKNNFINDKLLKIKHIKFKVRDLALSNFNKYYIANDLHIVRVSTRIGLLNYGYDLLHDPHLEMGNNPGNDKNYLFLHQLFLKLSNFTNDEYSPVDIDRIFWHFGRALCNNSPKCNKCPINDVCLTGKVRK